MQTNPVQDYIYLPPRAISTTLTEVQRRMNSPYYLDFGLPCVDGTLIPPVPGDLIGLIGRPGHAKTTTMIALAKRWSKLLQAQKSPSGRSPLVVYATWETTIEEFMAVWSAEHSGQSLESIGRRTANVQQIEDALVMTLANNVVVIGQSAKRNPDKPSRMPTVADLGECLKLLARDYEIGTLFVDYLQRIPHPKYQGEHDRPSKVSENTEWLKDLSVIGQFSTVMGVQASRQVDEYSGLKLPTLTDAQWASTIEQTADKLWGITIPGKYLPISKKIAVNDWEYAISQRTLVLRSLKQRFGPQSSSDVWVLDCDFAKAKLSEQVTTGEAEPYK